ncbi:hypothetical protein ACFY5D_01350 [Paeniglutamicibacter sp. NPDC012692]|uniref:hypothetical protein n=1 Tax=Paeniglutamicibacter sp. NPDC012692 TaxID=3364388 RepID=UPI0036BD68B2
MKNRMSLPLMLMFALVLAGCGDVSAQQSVSSSVSPTQSPSGCLASTYSESVVTERFECKAFTSTEGSASGQDLSWVASAPVQVEFGRMDESLTMTIRMPCGVLNVPVSIDADVINPDSAAMIQSADGCIGSTVEYRMWTTAFVKMPTTYFLDNQSLVLTNDVGQIKFKSS